MKNYRFTRPLDGVAVGDVREMSIDEAAPLLASTAIEPVNDEADPDVADAEPATAPANASVVHERPARAKKVLN
ncbi:hypothetical protein [Sphingomonas montana]|uniref:hypothetical protein n=1 Tax=Sphingomonas montana TaxID=1843236 RepID=UPI00096C6DBA|nr:hypothetical protein [Sphingomonas montana]